MNKVKRLTAVFFVTLLAVAVYSRPGSTQAASMGSCDTIDANSFCDSKAVDNKDVDVSGHNLGSNLDNLDLAIATTGSNSQSSNGDRNTIDSSSSDANYKSDNYLNPMEVSVQSGAEATNKNITNNSDGDTKATNNDDVKARIENKDTNLNNATIAFAASGLNEQNTNDDANAITTGWTDSYASSNNVVNSTLITTGSGAKAANNGVMGNSFADAKAENNNTVDVYVKNKNTDVTNTTVSISISGGNEQNKNGDANSIASGDSTAKAHATNYVNVVEVGPKGGSTGAVASNSNITNNSDGDAKATVNDNVTAKVENKDTTVQNTSVAVAATGGNNQNHNDDKNSTTTGAATAGGSTSNVVNAVQVHY